MLVRFYNFNKKINNTKIVPGDTTYIELNCRLREKTSILNPTLILERDIKSYNYAYIPSFSRYYFISSVSSESNLWIADLSVDVLASHRSDILYSSQYVLRASQLYDGTILDTYYPMTASESHAVNWVDGSVTSGSTTITGYFDRTIQQGSFVFGVLGNNTSGTTYYVANYTGWKNIINQLSIYFPSDMSDISSGIAKQLADPFQYITGCFWYPSAIVDPGSTSTTITFGSYSIAVQAVELTYANYVRYFDSTVSIPTHPKASTRGTYLNLSPYTNHTLYFEPFGTIPLNNADLVNVSTIMVRWYVDFTTGKSMLCLYKNGDMSLVLGCYYANYGIPIRLTTTEVDYLGALGGIVNFGSNLLFGGNPANGLFAIGDVAKSITPQPRTTGNQGSFIQQKIHPRVASIFHDIVDDDLYNVGRPLCQVKQLDRLLGGYIKTNNAIFESTRATDTEIKQIINFMNEGMYLM